MNDTTEIGTVPAAQDVRAYVAAVRAWLADLPAEEVEDLTAGMEADLAERAAESGERLGVLLGDPETYAAELRSAAGLPPRSVPVAVERRAGLATEAVSSAREMGAGLLLRWPWLRELRSAWWLARGFTLGGAAAVVLGTGRFLFVPLLGAALSFWVGQRLAGRTVRPVSSIGLGVVNGVAILLLVPVAFWASASRTVIVDSGEAVYPSSGAGVSLGGEALTNLYVYDAAGDRVEGARVYDPAGRPVFVDPQTLSVVDGSDPDTPLRPDNGQPDVATDAFPLRWGPSDPWRDLGFGWVPPITVPALSGYAMSPEPTTTPTPGGGQPPGPSPSASPSASVKPSPSSSSTP